LSGSPMAKCVIADGSISSNDSTVKDSSLFVIKTSSFAVKSVRVPSTNSSPSSNVFISFELADKNTSDGAPCSICCTSFPELPKLKVTLIFSCCCSKLVFMSVKASVKLAAADTIISTGSADISALSAEQPAEKSNKQLITKSHALFFNQNPPIYH